MKNELALLILLANKRYSKNSPISLTISSTMDIDTPPHLDNPLPAETEPIDKENGVTGAGTEVPTEGDIVMDAPDQPSLGTKALGASTSGAGIVSGKAGGDAGPEGRASGTGETGEAFPTRVADFFKPRPKGANGAASAKGKGKQTTSEEYLSGREGLPWCVNVMFRVTRKLIVGVLM